MPKVRGNFSQRLVADRIVLNYCVDCQQDFDTGFYQNHRAAIINRSCVHPYGILCVLSTKFHARSVLLKVYILCKRMLVNSVHFNVEPQLR